MVKLSFLAILLFVLVLLPDGLHAQTGAPTQPPIPLAPKQSPSPAARSPDPPAAKSPNPVAVPNSPAAQSPARVSPIAPVVNPVPTGAPTVAAPTRTINVAATASALVSVLPLGGDLAQFVIPPTLTEAPLPAGVVVSPIPGVVVKTDGAQSTALALEDTSTSSKKKGGLDTGAIVGIAFGAFGGLLLIAFVLTKTVAAVRRSNGKKQAVKYAMEHNKGNSLGRKEGSLTWGRKKQQAALPAAVKPKKDRVYPDNITRESQYGYPQQQRSDTYYAAPQQYQQYPQHQQYQYPPQGGNFQNTSNSPPYGGYR